MHCQLLPATATTPAVRASSPSTTIHVNFQNKELLPLHPFIKMKNPLKLKYVISCKKHNIVDIGLIEIAVPFVPIISILHQLHLCYKIPYITSNNFII